MSVALAGRTARRRGPACAWRPAAGWVGCVALAALSLTLPSAPTYDPMSWLIWAREITHWDLSTTGGPSWKPLPMLFLVPFSLFGDAAPDLWLIVTRAAALASLWAGYRLATRLGGSPVAGAATVGAMLVVPWQLYHAWLGNSESLVVLCLFSAINSHLDGRPRRTFLWALAIGLLRPEFWPWLGLYGVWFAWSERDELALVVGGFALLPLCWLLPELIGSGEALRAFTRAQELYPGAVGLDQHPMLAIVHNAAAMLSRTAYFGLALLAVGVRRWRHPRQSAAFGVLALAVAWVVVVMLTTSGGFSGSDRYLIAPVALLSVLAGVGLGWAIECLALGRSATAVAVMAAFAALLAPTLILGADVRMDMVHQARLLGELDRAVDRSGGAGRIKRCGRAATAPRMVPLVAWRLGVRLDQVTVDPSRSNVVLNVRTYEGQPAEPPTDGLRDPRSLGSSASWRIVAACQSSPSGPSSRGGA